MNYNIIKINIYVLAIITKWETEYVEVIIIIFIIKISGK